MDLLTFGLIFFFAVHSIPFFPKLRNGLYGKFGDKSWKIGFSLASLAGLVMIGFGYAKAEFAYLWQPPVWGYDAALYAMALAFVLIAARSMRGHIRKILRHPMLIGFFIWGAGHVFATGDLASFKMFGAFAIYSLVAIVSAEMRKKVSDHTPETKEDLKAVFTGLVVFAAFFFAHGWLFGAPLI